MKKHIKSCKKHIKTYEKTYKIPMSISINSNLGLRRVSHVQGGLISEEKCVGMTRFWGKMKVGVWGPKNGLPEFLAEANLIFWMWIFIFWGQKCQKWSQNVRNLGLTFGKMEMKKWGPQKRASWTSRWSKIDRWDMNIHIPGSKISKVIAKRLKNPKNICHGFPIFSISIFFIWFFKCFL